MNESIISLYVKPVVLIFEVFELLSNVDILFAIPLAVYLLPKFAMFIGDKVFTKHKLGY